MMKFAYHCNLHVLVYILTKSELLVTCTLRYTRRMLGIETASRACKNLNFIERSKVRKVNHAFSPEGIQIEDLTQASCHA